MKPPGKNSSEDNWGENHRSAEEPPSPAGESKTDSAATSEPQTGSVIDLVSERTRRALRRAEGAQSSRSGAPMGRSGSAATPRFGAISGLRPGTSSKTPPPRPLGFKIARALQLAVIFAGTLYLLHTCGYL